MFSYLFNINQKVPMFKVTPWETRFSTKSGFHAYLMVGDRSISYNMELDWDEELINQWGPISLVRIKSEDEIEEELLNQAEEESMERELCRYVAWHDAC